MNHCTQYQAIKTSPCMYTLLGGTILTGASMTTNDQANNIISCSGNEIRVSECSNTCKAAVKINTTLEVRCDNECTKNDCSIVIEVALGAVAVLLMTLLVATSTTALILGLKLKRTRHKRQYESEPHQYVEQQLGQ